MYINLLVIWGPLPNLLASWSKGPLPKSLIFIPNHGLSLQNGMAWIWKKFTAKKKKKGKKLEVAYIICLGREKRERKSSINKAAKEFTEIKAKFHSR